MDHCEQYDRKQTKTVPSFPFHHKLFIEYREYRTSGKYRTGGKYRTSGKVFVGPADNSFDSLLIKKSKY